MKLIPFSHQYLRLHEPLPFGLRDGQGRLLLAAGQSIPDAALMDELREIPLFAEEHESAAWQRRLQAAMDERIRAGASLKDVASVRPQEPPREGPAKPVLSLPEMWQELVLQLDAALRDARNGNAWVGRVRTVHARARALAARRFDASLYHLVYEAAHSVEKYSAHHAILCMLISEQAATVLAWEAPTVQHLGEAALTMNVAMVRLQDQLALSSRPPTPTIRAEIDAHAAQGATLLAEAGFDPMVVEVVRTHHHPGPAGEALAALTPAERLSRLLNRVDVFCAKISRREARRPMSPVQAAREACLGANNVPDEVGGALLKAVGLYPPGSFVELASGEIAIVLARGRRANLPYVASLISASGNPLGEPALRDTIEQRHAVRSAIPPDRVRVRPPHERLLAMR